MKHKQDIEQSRCSKIWVLTLAKTPQLIKLHLKCELTHLQEEVTNGLWGAFCFVFFFFLRSESGPPASSRIGWSILGRESVFSVSVVLCLRAVRCGVLCLWHSDNWMRHRKLFRLAIFWLPMLWAAIFSMAKKSSAERTIVVVKILLQHLRVATNLVVLHGIGVMSRCCAWERHVVLCHNFGGRAFSD